MALRRLRQLVCCGCIGKFKPVGNDHLFWCVLDFGRRMQAELTLTTSAGRSVHRWLKFSAISSERMLALDKKRRSLSSLGLRDARPVG